MSASDTLAQLLRGSAREGLGYLDTAATIGKNVAWPAVAGYYGIVEGLRNWDLNKGVEAIEKTQSLAGPQTAEGARNLEKIGKVVNWFTDPWKEQVVDRIGAVSPEAGAAVLAVANVADPTKGALRTAKTIERGAEAGAKAAQVANRVRNVERGAVPATTEGLSVLKEAGEGDIAKSLIGEARSKKQATIPEEKVNQALVNRAELRSEAPSLPKPAAEMTPEDWQAFGQQHGVNMTLTPSQKLGISDIGTKREIEIPGGLEGTFTIPDLFQMKSRNFDPNALPQDVHNTLMQKFMRTYERPGGMDPVDQFNALNFALLSPNAPLTPNEFLAQRLRVRDMDELRNIASTDPTVLKGMEQGTGAAARGGMGVKGTADLGNQAKLARMLIDNPQAFKPGPGETMRDVGRRVMNLIPGLGPKTASLGVPWLDLAAGNTSAVDLHMIRNNYQKLMADPELGGDFTNRIRTALASKVDFAPEMAGEISKADMPTLIKWAESDPAMAKAMEKAAIQVIGGSPVTAEYRLAKTGEINPRVHPALAPEKIGEQYTPKKATEFNPYYNRIVDYVDQSRGPNPLLPLFPEQWRLWDRYRGRIEPHEMAHPDWRKLPKMSWEEMRDALTKHREAGYLSTELSGTKKIRKAEEGDILDPTQDFTQLTGADVPWGELYYGRSTVPAMAAAGGLAAGGAALGQNEETREKARRVANFLRGSGAQR